VMFTGADQPVDLSHSQGLLLVRPSG